MISSHAYWISLWLDHSVSQIQLTNVTAGTVTVRSDVLESLSLEGTGHLDRLVLAARSGDVTLSLPETYTLGTLVVGDGTGTVDFTGTADALEVTGSGRTITVNSSLDSLVVSGSDNQITVARGCTVDQITILGTDNTLRMNGQAEALLLAGRDNTVSGSGRITEVTLETRYYTLTVPKNRLVRWENYDIHDVSIDLE